MLVFSEGILTVIKGAAKAGKLSEIIAKFPKVAELGQKAKTLGGDKVERLRIALKTSQPLLVARQWAANVLRIPAEILQDLSVEAIERLKQLPRWARDRFSELNHGAMRRVLGCASPCKVDIQQIQSYLRNLAVKGATGGKRLLSVDDILNALPQGVNTTALLPKLRKGPMLEAIKQAQLTDLDFRKLADFMDSRMTARNVKETFTAYLNAVVPSKIGPDINRFNEIAEAIVKIEDRQGSALKRPMFENFVRLYVPNLENLQKAWIPVSGGKPKRLDGFIKSTGEIWEIKHQFDKAVPEEQALFYNSYIGKDVLLDLKDSTQVAKVTSLNYLFPAKEAALKNKKFLPYGINIFYTEPANNGINIVKMLLD